MIEPVLHEILTEQKEMVKLSKQLAGKIESLSGKVESLEKPIQNIGDIKEVVGLQTKNIIHQKRIMIFPEFKSPECYRLLFNCIIYFTIATYCFLVIKSIVDHWGG